MLIKANAKINLYLTIKEETSDGYHNIESVFQSIDLPDIVELKKSKEMQLKGSILASKEEQLLIRSLRQVEKKVGRLLPLEITLHKTIPVASGMGGGSADAAALIVGVNQLYKLGLTEQELIEIASKIGSDVPFFISGGTKKVEGIGDVVSEITYDLAKYYVIVRPHKRVSTKEVYNKHRENKKTFKEIVAETCPDIDFLSDHFTKYLHKHSDMTGSGPTMFCGVDDFETAERIAYDLGNYNGDIFIVRPIDKAIEIIN